MTRINNNQSKNNNCYVRKFKLQNAIDEGVFNENSSESFNLAFSFEDKEIPIALGHISKSIKLSDNFLELCKKRDKQMFIFFKKNNKSAFEVSRILRIRGRSLREYSFKEKQEKGFNYVSMDILKQ